MIKIRRWFGMTVITGSAHEMECVRAISGAELSEGDRIAKLPYKHHVHRNPERRPLIRFLENKERELKRFNPIKTIGNLKELMDASTVILNKERADADAAGAGI